MKRLASWERLKSWEQLHSSWFRRELTDTQRGRGGDEREKERASETSNETREERRRGRERKKGKGREGRKLFLSLIPNSASILYTPNGGPIFFIGIFFFLFNHRHHYHHYLVKEESNVK